MKTINEIKKWMADNGYEMVQNLNGETWHCIKHCDDETIKTVWDDPACEDATDHDSAMFIAYESLKDA